MNSIVSIVRYGVVYVNYFVDYVRSYLVQNVMTFVQSRVYWFKYSNSEEAYSL
jgi:hypothetical protein